jgi:uncharacterized membrane protein YhaH (DUF805 family)
MLYTDALKSVWEKRFEFDGRVRRRDFWFGWPTLLLLGIAGEYAGFGLAILFEEWLGLGWVGYITLGAGMLWLLATAFMAIALVVRRLHDTGRSGWWWFIQVIPLVGLVVVIVLLASEGTRGPNRYGDSPKPVSLPAGWYPSGDSLRWWDGNAWTEHMHPGGPPPRAH